MNIIVSFFLKKKSQYHTHFFCFLVFFQLINVGARALNQQAAAISKLQPCINYRINISAFNYFLFCLHQSKVSISFFLNGNNSTLCLCVNIKSRSRTISRKISFFFPIFHSSQAMLHKHKNIISERRKNHQFFNKNFTFSLYQNIMKHQNETTKGNSNFSIMLL